MLKQSERSIYSKKNQTKNLKQMNHEKLNLNRNIINGLLCLIILLLISSNANAQKLTKRKVAKVFAASEVLQNHYTGFSLYDLKTMKPVYELDANKPAIPASNTKLFTLYTFHLYSLRPKNQKHLTL
jgi:hypothetical protein